MAQSNRYIESYLKKLAAGHRPATGATLIEGAWGSGKTTIVERCIPTDKIILISLADKLTLDDIYKEIFFKSAKVRGKVAKFAERVKEAALTYRGPGALAHLIPLSIQLQKEDFENKILVIDDLERCSINMEALVGLLMTLERLEAVVVIVANTGKLKNQFSQLKEKVIGKSFEIHAPVMSAYESVIGDASEDMRAVLNDVSKDINSCFDGCPAQSLRVFQRSIRELIDFLEDIDDLSKYDDELLARACMQVFAYSLVYYNSTDNLDRINSKSDEMDEPEALACQSELSSRFGTFINYCEIPGGLLYERLAKGFRDEARLNKRLDTIHAHRVSQGRPVNWRVLIELEKYPERDIETAYRAMESEYEAKSISYLGQLSHHASLFMMLSKMRVIKMSYDDICDKYISYAEELFGRFDTDAIASWEEFHFSRQSWAGFAFRVDDSYALQFNRYLDTIEGLLDGSLLLVTVKRATSFLARIRDADKFFEIVNDFNGITGEEFARSVSLLPAPQFVDWLIGLPREEVGKIYDASSRPFLKHQDQSEAYKRWLDSVTSLAKKSVASMNELEQYSYDRFFQKLAHRDIIDPS